MSFDLELSDKSNDILVNLPHSYIKRMRQFFFSIISIQVLSCFYFGNTSLAQESNKDYFPTPNTVTGAKPDPQKQIEKEVTIRYIIKNDTKKTLAGNLCFEEFTTKMGFQYLAVPKGQAPNKNGFFRWRHNFGVKFVLLFKNGPFWKIKVNKKYKECKYGSGDYVG